MPKITKVNIAAARAQKEVLERRGQPVPDLVERLAALDPNKLTSDAPEAPHAPVYTVVFAPGGNRLPKRSEEASEAARFYEGIEWTPGRLTVNRGDDFTFIVVDNDKLADVEGVVHAMAANAPRESHGT